MILAESNAIQTRLESRVIPQPKSGKSDTPHQHLLGTKSADDRIYGTPCYFEHLKKQNRNIRTL
jgi:hypothetical protein